MVYFTLVLLYITTTKKAIKKEAFTKMSKCFFLLSFSMFQHHIDDLHHIPRSSISLLHIHHLT